MSNEQPTNRAHINAIIFAAIIGAVAVLVAAIIAKSGQQPIAIALTNNHCTSLDFYVDGDLKAPALASGATYVFKTTSGEHLTEVCLSGTTICGGITKMRWSSSTTTVTIPRGSNCPITITLNNFQCTTINYYVDGQLRLASVAGGTSANFQSNPGQHSVYACVVGTKDCSQSVNENWTTSTITSVAHGVGCP